MEPFETKEEMIETTETTEIIEIEEPIAPVKTKKRTPTWAIILIVIFCALALCTALFFGTQLAFNGVSGCMGDMFREDIHFNDMEYVRPDEDAIIGKLDGIITAIEENTLDFDEQLYSLQQFDSDYYDIYTMYALATIKHSQDLTDEFYTEELDFFAEFLPLYSQKVEEIFVACAQSEYASDFEENYFGAGTLEAYAEGSTITDRSVELSQYTSEIVNQYILESDDPTITYNGEEVSLNEALSDPNISYMDYSTILHAYYEKYNPLFGEMYVSIVKSNMQIAEEVGYDSYIDYAYESYYRDYTPEDAAQYMEDIKTYMVPLFLQLSEDGWYNQQYNFFDTSDEDVLNILRNTTTEIGGSISNIFNYMERNGLYDFAASDVKEQLSYTTYLHNYEAPFIFVSPTGTDDDILTAIHEFGHFAESYINFGYESGLDSDETASQAMEFLALSYLDSTLTQAQINQIYTKKLLDTVDTFIYQGFYNEFETRVYSLDYEDVTVENLNAIASECADEFGLTDYEPWEDYYANCWIDIPHIYQSPFYVVSYCTGCDVALQIYEMSEISPSNASETYYDLIDWDWNLTFTENVERVGLESPFDDGRIIDCADLIEDYFYN